jgi:hypothetical protein
MITLNKSGQKLCEPQHLRVGEIPDYICLPAGNKQYLSKEQKKDYIYGGECPRICSPVSTYTDSTGISKGCPDISQISDVTLARNACNIDTNCHFIPNSVLNRMGPNFCNVKSQTGCMTLTEEDLKKDDKTLTNSSNICDRMGVGCIFNRGNGNGIHSRKGNPTCLRGCQGSKYWNNPDYIWGGGGTKQDPYEGAFYNSDLKLGPKYLEASPSDTKPDGWGGSQGPPFMGNGKLPRDLGIAYTESKGKHVPPCNLKAGDSSVFAQRLTGESLAGPGCKLTPPHPQYGLQDWTYTCNCPYLGDGGEFKSDAWKPCTQFELEQDVFSKRNVCEGCWIQDNPEKSLYGKCILGEETPDTESKLLGCIEDPNDPEKCRIKRIIHPTECPSFCSKNSSDLTAWRSETQCSDSLTKKYWETNPEYSKIINLEDRIDGRQAAPYRPGPNFNNRSKPKDTDYLCRNCSQTHIKTLGSGSDYPNRSYCLVGGSESANSLGSDNFGKYLAKTLSCPPTCKQCSVGFFGEPMKPIYKLDEASNSSSAFSKGIIYVPEIGEQAVKELTINTKEFEQRMKEGFENTLEGFKNFFNF